MRPEADEMRLEAGVEAGSRGRGWRQRLRLEGQVEAGGRG